MKVVLALQWLASPSEKVSRFLMFVKGKVMFAPVFQLFMIYSSWRRDPERIRGDP